MKSWSAIGAVIVLLFGAQIGAAQTSWKSTPSRSGAEAIATSDPVQWNKGWSSSSVAASRAPGDLGPLVPVRIGESEMLLPDAYLSDISRRHGLNSVLILDGLFPDFSPINRENSDSFRYRTVNKVIRVSIFGLELLTDQQKSLRLSIGMAGSMKFQLRYSRQNQIETLWDRLEKADSNDLDLFSFRIRESFLLPHVMERVTARPPEFRWYSELARWDDWYFEEDGQGITRYIGCTNHLVPDPTDEQLNRHCTPRNPCGLISVPYCTHQILSADRSLRIEIFYRRVYLQNWKEIESSVRGIMDRALSLAAERR